MASKSGIINVNVIGLDRIKTAINKFPHETKRYLEQAGDEAAKRVIFETEGVKRYPPETGANRPPTPYYIRGQGMQYKSGNRGGSERYGTQWYTQPQGYKTEVGNRASYAKWLGGEQQARHMAPLGWRKLFEVAKEKLPEITKVYQAWVDKLIRDLGL